MDRGGARPPPGRTGQERGPHAPDKDVTGARYRAMPGARHRSQRGHRTHRTAADGAHRAWVRSWRPDRHVRALSARPRGVTVDHETEVAAPKAPAAPEVDERIAAFKRGAPLPKTASPKTAAPKTASPKTAGPKTASPKTEAPEAPKPPRPARARPAPKPKADRPDDAPDTGAAASPGEPAEGGEGTGSSSGARRRRRGGRGRGGGTRPAEDSTQNGSTRTDTEADVETDPPVTARVRVAGPADLDDRVDSAESVRHGGDDRWRLDVVRGAAQAPAPWWPRPRPWRGGGIRRPGAGRQRRHGTRAADRRIPARRCGARRADGRRGADAPSPIGFEGRIRAGIQVGREVEDPLERWRVGQERQRRRRGCQACVRRPAFPRRQVEADDRGGTGGRRRAHAQHPRLPKPHRT